MDNQDEEQYLCVGICMADPDSGYCLGCGRPPLGAPEIVAEAVTQTFAPVNVSTESDHPE
ncbi:MAG: hypothetical protein CVU16_13460 [Betaproteobacteria bacterium HGW-Betaproteobacteria-10]|jgi:hypothetical protein|nr:MAG: hypothetical protein CVU16_13460 [Betaproteobacteria bacterium HGW-Betaproteobacteria-10]